MLACGRLCPGPVAQLTEHLSQGFIRHVSCFPADLKVERWDDQTLTEEQHKAFQAVRASIALHRDGASLTDEVDVFLLPSLKSVSRQGPREAAAPSETSRRAGHGVRCICLEYCSIAALKARLQSLLCHRLERRNTRPRSRRRKLHSGLLTNCLDFTFDSCATSQGLAFRGSGVRGLEWDVW